MNLQKQQKLLQKEMNKNLLSSLLQKNISITKIYNKKQISNKKLIINQQIKNQRLIIQQVRNQQARNQQARNQQVRNQQLKIQQLKHQQVRFKQMRNYQIRFRIQQIKNQQLKLRLKQIQIKKNKNKNKEQQIDLETLLKLNKNITKIVSCYADPPRNGLGDFIRGSVYLFQLCDKYNIDYDIVISNVITNFLKNNNTLYNNIELINLPNAQSTKINKNLINLNTNVLKINSNYVLYNKQISDTHKEVIKKCLEPNDKITNTVNNILTNINYNKKDYIIIHIRTGDSNGNDIDKKQCNSNLLNSIYNKLNTYEEYFKTNKVFVISDNTSVKTALKEKYNFECHLDEISHFSDKKGSIGSHKTTFIDFVLMSQAKQIISLTVYNHYKGSGFSYWCSALYDIPYHFLSI